MVIEVIPYDFAVTKWHFGLNQAKIHFYTIRELQTI